MHRLRRSLVTSTVVLAALALAACGNHPDEDAPVVRAESEGLYLTIGELKYQVQVSRQLNEHDVEDRAFLVGLPVDERELGSDDVWFAVFLRVQNETDEPLNPSGAIQIIDTQDEVFEPIPLDDTNPYAYRSLTPIEGGDIRPEPDSPSYGTANQGALVLFKLKLKALDNRPLELKIEGSQTPAQTGIIDLDV